MSTVVVIILVAVLLCLGGTAYAWSDWYRRPDRYGVTERDRGKRRRWLTRPTRGTTRQPISNWFAKARLRR
jgi:hypothetical protein